MNILRFLTLLALFALSGSFTHAQGPKCSFNITNISFGTVDVKNGRPYDATGTLNYNCTGDSREIIRICPSLGLPSNGPRFLTDPSGNKLFFNLYSDASRTTLWGTWYSKIKAPSIDVPIGRSQTGGGTATIALSWPTTATPFVDATITITGGTCALAATPSLAGLIPNISGTYSGNVTITNTTTQASSTGTATLQLGQLDTPNQMGQFALSGTLAVTSSVCSETSAMNGEVGGLSFELTLPDPNSPAADVSLNGATDPAVPAAGLSFGADYASFNAGTCSGNLVIGTLTAQ